MKKEEIREIIENQKIDEIQRIRERENEDFEYIFNNSQFQRFRELIEKNFDSELKIKNSKEDEDLFKIESINDSDEFIIIKREYQMKIKRERDIKIISDSKINYSLKMIYHINKDDKKEYRIYISYKDSSNKSSKIKRIKLSNDEIKKSNKNFDKMKKIYSEILKIEERDEILKKYNIRWDFKEIQ